MKKLIGITLAIFLTSSLLFVTVCAGGGEVTKHVKGKWSGIGYFLGPGFCPDKMLMSISIGKGVMTITGASEWYSVGCLLPTEEGGEFEGDAIITAANGDKLFLRLKMRLDDGIWRQKNIIIGGTGMFDGARGDGTATGTFQFIAKDSPMDAWEGTNEGDLTLVE